MASRNLVWLGCLLLFVEAGQAQVSAPGDQHAKDLLAKYNALPEKDRGGAEGDKIIKALQDVDRTAKLSPPVREAITRLVAAHNLRKLAEALGKAGAGEKVPWAVDGTSSTLLPYLETGRAPRRWEYKVVWEGGERKEALLALLNKLGEDGWEMVGADKGRFFFKRPRPPSPAARAPADVPADAERLRGTWVGPALEFRKGLKGHIEMRFEFKGVRWGLATLELIPQKGFMRTSGPYLVRLEGKGKEREVVFFRLVSGKSVEVGAVPFELTKDGLKLPPGKKLKLDVLEAPFDLGGEWKRKKPAGK